MSGIVLFVIFRENPMRILKYVFWTISAVIIAPIVGSWMADEFDRHGEFLTDEALMPTVLMTQGTMLIVGFVSNWTFALIQAGLFIIMFFISLIICTKQSSEI